MTTPAIADRLIGEHVTCLPIESLPLAQCGGAVLRENVYGERDAPPFDWARETAKHIGVVAHRFLAQFARDGLSALFYARTLPLAAGYSARFPVVEGGRSYAVDADPIERLSAPANALRFVPGNSQLVEDMVGVRAAYLAQISAAEVAA